MLNSEFCMNWFAIVESLVFQNYVAVLNWVLVFKIVEFQLIQTFLSKITPNSESE